MGHIACAASLQDPVDRAEAWLHCNGMQEDGGDGVAAEDRNGFGDEGEGEEAEEDEEGGWEMEVRRLVTLPVTGSAGTAGGKLCIGPGPWPHPQ